MHRPLSSSLRNNLHSRRRSLSALPRLALWGGTTHPHGNQKTSTSSSTGLDVPLPDSASHSEKIERIHHNFVEELLNRRADSVSGLGTSVDTKLKTAAPRPRSKAVRHSLSEPPLFRTDGPLTPYPIELDSGELLEPKHATLVRIIDRQGEERTIVVADVEEESGSHRRVLLAVDLKQYQNSKTVVGRKVSAEQIYTTIGLEPPKV